MDQFSRGFSYLAPFGLPGLLGLYALSFHSPMVKDWFGAAATQPTTVGGFLFAAAASLGIGLFLSGVRWLAVDRWFDPPPAFDSRLRLQAECERVYQDVRLQHYVFYQFYANTLCAVVVLYGSWLVAERPAIAVAGPAAGGALIAGLALWLSAENALQNYDRKMRSLAGLLTTSSAARPGEGEDLVEAVEGRPASQ